MDSRFFVSKTWMSDSELQWDSGFFKSRNSDYHATIPDSSAVLDSGIRIPLHGSRKARVPFHSCLQTEPLFVFLSEEWKRRFCLSLVPRPGRAIRVTRGGLEPSAIARIFPTSLTGDIISEIAEDDWERDWFCLNHSRQAFDVTELRFFFSAQFEFANLCGFSPFSLGVGRGGGGWWVLNRSATFKVIHLHTSGNLDF